MEKIVIIESSVEPRVLVKQKEKDTMLGNLILPETIGEQEYQGEVIKVSTGQFKSPLNEGDTVLFSKHNTTKLTIEGIDYLIMAQSNIFAAI